tara:strand:+ start:640 stop:774 length:135 start_codon:yes stop_codon:yes gene_type:complete
MKNKKLKSRNPYATALMLRHGGGVKVHKDKKRYCRKQKHKVKLC